MRRAIVAMVALLLVPFGGTALADDGEATVAGTGWPRAEPGPPPSTWAAGSS